MTLIEKMFSRLDRQPDTNLCIHPNVFITFAACPLGSSGKLSIGVDPDSFAYLRWFATHWGLKSESDPSSADASLW